MNERKVFFILIDTAAHCFYFMPYILYVCIVVFIIYLSPESFMMNMELILLVTIVCGATRGTAQVVPGTGRVTGNFNFEF